MRPRCGERDHSLSLEGPGGVCYASAEGDMQLRLDLQRLELHSAQVEEHRRPTSGQQADGVNSWLCLQLADLGDSQPTGA